MLLNFGWLETIVIFGLLLVAFGPERIGEILSDVRKLWNDTRRAFRRGPG